MNREIYPNSVYPLQGDVTSQAGQSTVTVTGLQNIPVAGGSTILNGSLLAYLNGTWTPTLRAAIQVNGVTVSDDYLITVNVPKPVLVNGS